VKEKRQCIIATATYGSELSPEVQFLREFRDKYVLKMFAGRNFMNAFDAWYYSFSPTIAPIIANNNPIREVMKILLYPLIATLHFSATTFQIFSFNPEFSIITAGLTAASLIGIVYLAPCLLILCKIRKVKLQIKHLHLPSLILMSSTACIAIAEITQSQNLMMISTSIFILNTISLATLTATIIIKKLGHYLKI
jgi:peptide/nickel transport system substrate-binding protein